MPVQHKRRHTRPHANARSGVAFALAALIVAQAAAPWFAPSTSSSSYLVAAEPLSRDGHHQKPFRASEADQGATSASSSSKDAGQPLHPTHLHGRFIHITDLHPDTFYKYDSAVVSACHSNKPKRKKKAGRQRAGWWGTGVSECDAPRRLVTATLDWIARNWLPRGDARCNSVPSGSSSGQAQPTSSSSATAGCQPSEPGQGIDFIIWTGDSARHDIDSSYPRTRQEIYESNRWTVEQLEARFPGVPLVPSIGNNDIFPHNIMFPGPNEITRAYTSVWANHLPEAEFHTFQKGGYYVKELIAGDLAVLSLNTLYWYDSNKAVDGCPKKKKHKDPGNAQLDWLETQLMQLRKRGMQVHLVGHVPPTAGNYFPRCYDRYTDIVLRFQDTVIGQWFGHMNTDALFIQEDAAAAAAENLDGAPGHGRHDDEPGRVGTLTLEDDLRADYRTLPGERRADLDLYHAFWVAPSVIPTYWPSVRVWTYNTTRSAKYRGAVTDVDEAEAGMEEQRDEHEQESDEEEEGKREQEEEEEEEESDEDDELEDGVGVVDGKVDAETGAAAMSPTWRGAAPEPPNAFARQRRHRRPRHHKRRKGKGRGRKKPPRHASPDSPWRTNTYLSLLGYSQWVLDIDAANAEHERGRRWRRRRQRLDEARGTDVTTAKKHHRKHGHGGGGGGDDDNGNTRGEQLHYFLEYATYEPATLWREFGGGGASPAAAAAAASSDVVVGREAAGADGELEELDRPHVPVPKHLLARELKRLGVNEADVARLVSSSRGAAAAADVGEGEAGATDEADEAVEVFDAMPPTWRAVRWVARLFGVETPHGGSLAGGGGGGRRTKALKHLTEYSLPSATLANVMHLGRRLAVQDGLWRRYVRRIYSSSGASE